MAEILLFKPKHVIDAKNNLSDFIEMCRDRLTVFGADLEWERDSWPGVGNFTVIGAPARGFTESQLLNSEIVPFAKAYVRYQQGHKPNKLKYEFKAIRCIEKALLQVKGRADITLTDIQVMDVAAEVAREYKSTAYQAGSSLVHLVNFLNESKIISWPIKWKNPISKPKEIDRTDVEGKKKRAEKMPEQHLLEYMGEMFANDLQAPRDRFTTSIFALLMCAPSRISEVQDLPLNCLHIEVDSKGVERLGLRFYAGKGYGADIKWVSTVTKDIAVEAVRRLAEMSEDGRRLAAWYETHPDKFYRHVGCPNVGELEPLSDEQAAMALGLSLQHLNVDPYFKGYKPYQELKAKGERLTLAFLNTFAHSKLPEDWPWKNKERHIRYSQALCCFRRHQFHLDRVTSPLLLWSPGKSTFTTDLNYIPGQESNIWRRHGYANPDGNEISMTSHQLRHFLNTIAQRGDLGQLDLAKWSGRANIHQNATYNHMSDDEYVDLARQAGVGGVLAKIKANTPVTLTDLNAIGDGIAHVTEYGFCVHDFSMLPCQKHRDCLNCTEQVCIKGDDERLERLKQQRDGIFQQLEKARGASEDGLYGADRWSQHQHKTLERVTQLIEILESLETPIGSVICLSDDQEFSPLKRELDARSKTSGNVPTVTSGLPSLDDMRALLRRNDG
ncbi:integrase [Pseudomonas sp. Irchel 3F6]|uniref:integrase n=1 Tax=Pseudomonas sp. Irchel 3F6 TaxID=2009003 RepID=UPI000BA38970|nr:integrase [Pseudomonas sp. Irchel 3F6]